ncbi:MAG: RsiV family protein [Lachnospiraceae bacterium]|nr:RsiV family protein [Lachnospiraceae bacterium]
MKSLKRVIGVLIAGTLVFSLTACSDQSEIMSVMEEFEDLSDEEKSALIDAYENGDTDPSEVKDQDTSDTSDDEDESISDPETSRIPKINVRSVVDYGYSDDHEKMIFRSSCEIPVLAPESGDLFPELKKTLDTLADEYIESVKEHNKELVEAAKEHYNDSPDFFDYGSYNNDSVVLIRRIDEKVFSYAQGWDSYTGGAHGLYSETGHTFDVSTGKELMLSDIIPDDSGLKDALSEKLLEKYDEETFFDLGESLSHYVSDANEYDSGDEENYEDYICPYNWTLIPDGIQFYFGPYELAAYAYGSQQVVIGYDEYPKVFNPDYLPGDEEKSFIFDFTGMTDIFDIDGDGENDQLRADFEYSEDYINAVSVYVNGDCDTIGDDLWIEPGLYKSHYIRLKDGRQYLYTEGFVYDDHREFFVFDLNSGVPKASDRAYLDYIYFDDDNTEYFERNTITDPENMELDEIFYILATFYGVRTYHPGEDGMPVSDDRFMIKNLDFDDNLTSKEDITCDIVDRDGNVISEKETIKAGEEFVLYATDGETYVDAVISDDTIVRLNITSTEYPCSVDGVPADELFEVLFYVG